MNLSDIGKIMPGDLCLLCGKIAAVAALFVPENSAKWGAAPGLSRLFRYCLCSKCKSSSGVEDKVEKILRAELAVGQIVYRG